MSWEATAWAKKTRGHRSHACGRVLMVLACYYNEEEGVAWPSQAMLAEDCEMPKRTVQWCLASLEKQGFITTLQKGNQYQPTKYRLNFQVVKAQGATSEPATIIAPSNLASSSEGARCNRVKAQDEASEGASPRHTNHQEPSLIEPTPNNKPRWAEILASDSRWVEPKNGYIADIDAKFGTLVDLTIEAHNCLNWLQTSPKGKKRKDIPGTWLNWLKRASTGGSTNAVNGGQRNLPANQGGNRTSAGGESLAERREREGQELAERIRTFRERQAAGLDPHTGSNPRGAGQTGVSLGELPGR